MTAAKNHRRRTAWVAVTACAVLVAGACNDDGNDAGTVPTGPDLTFATAPTPDPSVAETVAPSPTNATTDTVALDASAVVFNEFARVSNPVDLAWRKSDPAVYVVGQDGLIVQLFDGVAGPTVLDISDSVSFGGEQGLLGLAFHPTEPLAYVDYTRPNGDTVIAEYAVGSDGTFEPASAREVLVIEQPYGNHNGGDLTFGPDGYLYIGTGDGGSANDPERRGLNAGQLLGKLLRIDPIATSDAPYTVPADNPFVGVAGARPEIWSVGLRNPWRFNFDTATGDLWIGDVGQNEWEEIDLTTAVQGAGRGVNFGWSAWEGTHRFNDDQPDGGVTMPIFEYPHGDAGCSVSGGDVYRGAGIASLQGWYLFSDYCSGIITALQATDGTLTGQVALGQIAGVSAICAGPDGELYVLSLGDGTVYRVDPA